MNGYRWGFVFIGLLLIITLVSILYSRWIIREVTNKVHSTSYMIASLISQLIIPSLERLEIQETIKEVLKGVDFPILVTDEMGLPRAWHKLGIPPQKFSYEELSRPNLLLNDPDYMKLWEWKKRLERLNKPIELKLNNETVGYLYYGPPEKLGYIQILPIFIIFIFLISLIIFTWYLRSLREIFMKDFWASFAKGLAHQMGAPVSSLWGWYEIMKGKGSVDEEILKNFETELSYISGVLRRFSKIGGITVKEKTKLGDILDNAIDNLKRRFILDERVEIRVIKNSNDELVGDFELLSWAFENLIKNAYEARDTSLGAQPRILVKIFREESEVVVTITDNGRGIPKDKIPYLFKRAFTTKERGWGTGLLLVKRIIEDIHKGRIRLLRSEPYVETTFEIRFPLGEVA